MLDDAGASVLSSAEASGSELLAEDDNATYNNLSRLPTQCSSSAAPD